jgi:hypothetical protein
VNQLPKEQVVEKSPPLMVQVSASVVGFPREFVHTVAMFFKEQAQIITNGNGTLVMLTFAELKRDIRQEGDSPTDLYSNELGIETLEILEIIARSHPNRLLLKHYQIFGELIALASAAVNKLGVLISDRATESSDKLKMIEFVKFTLTNCFKIFAHFMESHNVLHDEVTDSLTSPRSASTNSISSWLSNEKRRRQQFMTELFQNIGAISVITGNFQFNCFNCYRIIDGIQGCNQQIICGHHQ